MYDTLENHYRTNFAMMQHHQYRLAELESMLPWERIVYVSMLNDYVKQENDRIQQQNKSQRKYK